jgi:NADPH:quinone reductase-like Zn-dependent oxidoreductase
VRALVLPARGADPVLREVPAPTGPARVRTLAAGLNPVDLAVASGRFYLPLPEPPYVLGCEGVGEVLASAAHPTGTLVWSVRHTGGHFAEEFAAEDAALVPVPEGLPPAFAAALGIAGLAGWMPVASRGAMRPGEHVVVLGASGVAGRVAVQAARALGAGRVVAVGRDAASLERAAALGADATVRIGEGDLAAGLRDACGGGADLVVDMLWGEPLAACLGVLRRGARVVQVGSAAGQSAQVVAGPLRGGRIDVRGFSVFSEDPADVATGYRDLCRAALAGEVRLDLLEVPLSDAPAAWASQAAGTAGRKIVLVP